MLRLSLHCGLGLYVCKGRSLAVLLRFDSDLGQPVTPTAEVPLTSLLLVLIITNLDLHCSPIGLQDCKQPGRLLRCSSESH